MTLDLSLIKEGAKLHLRCGGLIPWGADDKLELDSRYPIRLGSGESWDINGSRYTGFESFLDIIRIEPASELVKIVRYVNIFEYNLLGGVFHTQEEAKEYSSGLNNDGAYVNRIDCLEITYTVGQGATVRSVLNDA